MNVSTSGNVQNIIYATVTHWATRTPERRAYTIEGDNEGISLKFLVSKQVTWEQVR